VSPVKYEVGVYIPADCILHSPGRENLKSYILLEITFPVEDVAAGHVREHPYDNQRPVDRNCVRGCAERTIQHMESGEHVKLRRKWTLGRYC
jgi:hypothetical protein